MVNNLKTNDSVDFQNKYLSSSIMATKYEKIYSDILSNGSEKND